MKTRTVFNGQAIKSELVVTILEKWELHPTFKELSPEPDPDNLERPTEVLIPEEEYDRAHEVLYGESEIEQAEF